MTVTAMLCRPLSLFSVTPYAELVAGFVVKFKMLRRPVMARLAVVYEPVHPMVEKNITVIGCEFHRKRADRAEDKQ